MSSQLDRAAIRAAERVHAKARMWAAQAIDVDLQPADAAWLSEHLSGCADCRAVGAEYRALHDELRGLESPEPPRDLWARTSAALDGMDRSGARRSGKRAGSRRRLAAINRSFLGSAVAIGVTVGLAGLSLLSHGPLHTPGPGPADTGSIALTTVVPGNGGQAPLAVVDGTSYWMAPENGVYQIRSGAADCAGAAASCTVTHGSGTVLGSIVSESAVSVVIGPNAEQAAVWTAGKIVVLPLTVSAPKTVSIDLLTPRPTSTVGPSEPPLVSATPSATPSTATTPATTPETVNPATTPSTTPSTTPESVNPATPSSTASSTAPPSSPRTVHG